MVEVHYEDVDDHGLEVEKISNWLNEVASKESFELGSINLIFCSDNYLLEVNRKHLNHDYYTDIITFDYTEDDVLTGDLFISMDRVKDNAESQSEMFHVELLRVIVHGVLHLMGYKDKSSADQEEMRSKEDWALGLIVSRET